ncbi:MAG: P-II family nitrogen regulator [Atopobiaceae bacterium]|nr:P-II family nitrogen regulator [Atopobiaceae bacterium]MCH4181455.1 P-II family nitrogen regulator [Atopobiaceae bacterium]MCH4213488.1 P-II family nitrogen regulator [Atopobiaceae bacterium]MCH4229710.1 P-II family nitrogen regulator [Atopobiaceae bacterium]MCI1226464.1 P-II family nitrogen regulator [Atopobiaceae bacterium]
MKKIEAIVRWEVIEDVKDALFAAEVRGMTISEVQGVGNQHGMTEYIRGAEVLVQMRQKCKVEIVCDESRVDTIVGIICDAARTQPDGAVGDGKVFVLPVDEVVRIRTGDRGSKAI